MCGIAGWANLDHRTPPPHGGEELLRSMCDRMHHRGPDSEGYLLDEGIALGMRRLAIIDLLTGEQPAFNEDHSIAVVFNGEIYNYRELRDELARLGCVFRTQTDTEVLLHAYVTWGPACLRRLIGIFAFVVLDQRRRLLFLARDFFGMKPLYYVQATLPSPSGRGAGREGVFAFGAEIKALLDWLTLKRTVQPQRLYEYLRFGRTNHSAQTLASEIRRMPAANYLEVPLDRPERRR